MYIYSYLFVCTSVRTTATEWKRKCSNNDSDNNNNKIKLQEFMYRDITNVEPEMYDYTSNNWSH